MCSPYTQNTFTFRHTMTCMISKIVIGSLELKPENGYYIQTIKDIGYKTKYPVAKVLYTHGAKIGDVYLENRAIAIEMVVGAPTVNEFIGKRNDLYKTLTIKEFTDDYIDIDFHLLNGLVLTTKGVIKDVNCDITVDSLTHSPFAFVIETEEPFLKSKQVYQVEFGLSKGGGAMVPMTIPLNMSIGSSGSTQVSNGGNVFVFPEIYFYGVLTNPILKNLTTGKEIAITDTIAANNHYYIDTYNHIVKNSLGANKRDKIAGDFLTLEIGDNQLKLTSDNTSENGRCRLIYQYFYISI